MSMPAITKQLKVLEKAGLITREKSAQRRPCLIRPKGFQAATDWILEHQQLWNDRFDRLDPYIKTLESKEKGETNDPDSVR
jgi:DNA-binding MarR family transcriptional regulator